MTQTVTDPGGASKLSTKMAPKMKKTAKELKEAKRMQDKVRIERLKSDPETARLLKLKRHESYLKSKERGTTKMITQMSAREKRAQRKQWRKNTQACRERKKAPQVSRDAQTPNVEEEFVVDTPIEAVSLSTPSHQTTSGKKRMRRDRSAVVRENRKLKQQNEQLKKRIQSQKKQLQRARKVNISPNTKSPGRIVNALLAKNQDGTIRRKLLFGEVLGQQIREETKKLKTHQAKREAAKIIVGDGKQIKKYGLVTECAHLIPLRMIMNASKSEESFTVRQATVSQEETKQRVIKFLEEDEHSKCLPGKKDCLTKSGVKKQKRLLLGDLIDLHRKFNESSSTEISYSTFCRFRPFWVVAPNIEERETCLCKMHENFQLRIHALYKRGIIESSKIWTIEEQLCCKPPSVDCYQRKCSFCRDNTLRYIGQFDGSQPLAVEQWMQKKNEYLDPKTNKMKTNNRMMKVKEEKPLLDVVKETESQIDSFLQHEGNIMHQHQSIKALEAGEILLHCDFSENYNTKYNSEIQAVHFGGNRTNISMHTVVVYHLDDEFRNIITRCFCTVSENLDHGPAAVWAHLEPIFNHLKDSINVNITKLHVLSDGPSAQYRNRTIFYLLQHRLKKVFPSLTLATWNYHEAGHGKGAPDGVGGTLKRTADRMVAQGDDIVDIDSFIQKLSEKVTSVTLLHVQGSTIHKMKESISKNLFPFKGTLRVHQVVWKKGLSQLHMNYLSCFACPIECLHHKIGTHTTFLGGSDEEEESLDEEPLADVSKVQPEMNYHFTFDEEPVEMERQPTNHDGDPVEMEMQPFNLIQHNNDFSNNNSPPTKCTSGLCFSCGATISSRRTGILCSICCNTGYHDDCLDIEKVQVIEECGFFGCDLCEKLISNKL